jgi:integrase
VLCGLYVFGGWARIAWVDPLAQMGSAESHVKPFEPEEIQRLLMAAEQGRHRLRDRAMLLLFLDTGARLSELAALRVDDLGMENGLAMVRRGKGGSARTVSFGAEARRALWKHLRGSGAVGADFVFRTERGCPFDMYSVRHWINRLGERGGVEDAHCHRLRHTAAISYLRAGAPQLGVMRLLGHRSPAMTQRYCMIADTDLAAMAATCAPSDRILGKSRKGA